MLLTALLEYLVFVIGIDVLALEPLYSAPLEHLCSVNVSSQPAQKPTYTYLIWEQVYL